MSRGQVVKRQKAMISCRAAHGKSPALPSSVAVAAVLLLIGCVAPAAQTAWVKSGAGDSATSHAVAECRSYADQVQSKEQGINEDRTATLGRNWALSYTTGLEANTMREQTVALTRQNFDNCMLARGFARRR